MMDSLKIILYYMILSIVYPTVAIFSMIYCVFTTKSKSILTFYYLLCNLYINYQYFIFCSFIYL